MYRPLRNVHTNNKLILEYVSDLDIFITTYKLEKIKEKVNAS